MRFLLRVVVVASCGVMIATPASAQLQQGRLIGTVVDAQGSILPGVTVTATSPALIGSQVAVTEADGRYLFPSLPSGTYSLAFDLSGFRAGRRQNIVLALGQTLNVDLTMAAGDLAGDGDRHRRVAGGRHVLHSARLRVQQREAGQRADGDRHLGGARAGAGREDARLRRRHVTGRRFAKVRSSNT